MDVQIDEINTTMRMMDANALLTPQMMEQIIRAVMARMKDNEAGKKARDDGSALRPSASSHPTEQWKS